MTVLDNCAKCDSRMLTVVIRYCIVCIGDLLVPSVRYIDFIHCCFKCDFYEIFLYSATYLHPL